jgi:hypothetical protein
LRHSLGSKEGLNLLVKIKDQKEASLSPIVKKLGRVKALKIAEQPKSMKHDFV